MSFFILFLLALDHVAAVGIVEDAVLNEALAFQLCPSRFSYRKEFQFRPRVDHALPKEVPALSRTSPSSSSLSQQSASYDTKRGSSFSNAARDTSTIALRYMNILQDMKGVSHSSAPLSLPLSNKRATTPVRSSLDNNVYSTLHDKDGNVSMKKGVAAFSVPHPSPQNLSKQYAFSLSVSLLLAFPLSFLFSLFYVPIYPLFCVQSLSYDLSLISLFLFQFPLYTFLCDHLFFF